MSDSVFNFDDLFAIIDQISIDDIVKILTIASDSYYNVGQIPETIDLTIDDYDLTFVIDSDTLLTDSQFDNLERYLRSIDSDNDFFTKVGSDVRGGKVKLPFTMAGLDQLYEGDNEKWIAQHNLHNEDIVLSDKLDGTSAALVYDKKGNFIAAYSRGNGIEGADITRHVKNFKNIPKTLSSKKAALLRAEVVIPIESWVDLQMKMQLSSGRNYKNPRNCVAGKMNSSDGDPNFYENAHLIITSVEDPEMSKVQQLEFCHKEGFLVTNYVVVKGRDITDEFLTKYLNERRSLTKYEIDGIVEDIDDVNIRQSIPRTSSNPNPTYSKKFKISSSDNYAQTTVVKVHWNVSKNGYLKPRIEIKPVELSGVTITFATGFNAKFIVDNKIGPGAVVEITRSGDVIPYITGVLQGAIADIPDFVEHGSYHYTEGDVDFVLDDIKTNKDVILGKLLDFSRGLDIPNLKEASLEKLLESGYDTITKIIKLDLETMKSVVGNAAGEKIFNGLRTKLNPIEPYILAGSSQMLGRGIGKRKVKKVFDAYGSLDVTLEDLINVEGFEQKTASLLMENIPEYLNFLCDIEGYYTFAEKKKPTSNALSEQVFVFTGVRDKDLEQKIQDAGGIIGSSVNKKTTYLICKDPTANSSKLTKAVDLGVKLIGINEALEMWG